MAKKKELTSGQTSDQNIESINLDVLPEVEEGYKPKFECNDLSEFFTPKDFAFMLIDFQNNLKSISPGWIIKIIRVSERRFTNIIKSSDYIFIRLLNIGAAIQFMTK